MPATNSEPPPVFIDTGASMCRAGILDVDNDSPRVSFPCVVGTPHRATEGRWRATAVVTTREHYIGYAAKAKSRFLNLKYPLTGDVRWDDVEKIWSEIYRDLNLEPNNQAVLMSEPVTMRRNDQEKMTQILFETFNVPAMRVNPQPVLASFSKGHFTSLMVESGHEGSSVVPIYDGHVLRYGMQTSDVGGRAVSEYLEGLLGLGYNGSLRSTAQGTRADIVEQIKEQTAYVAPDFVAQMKAHSKHKSGLCKYFTLPDGEQLAVNDEQFRCAEILFCPAEINRSAEEKAGDWDHARWKPWYLGVTQQVGLGDMALRAVRKIDMALHGEMYQNTLVCGGNTLLSGFPERLQTELSNARAQWAKMNNQKFNPRHDERVIAPANRHLMTYIGGMIYLGMSCIHWMKKEEYDEQGPGIVHRFCF